MPPLINLLSISYLIPFSGFPSGFLLVGLAGFLPPLFNPDSVLLANTLTDCPALSGISLPRVDAT